MEIREICNINIFLQAKGLKRRKVDNTVHLLSQSFLSSILIILLLFRALSKLPQIRLIAAQTGMPGTIV